MLKTRARHWYFLFTAIVLEVSGSTVMKLAQEWTFPHAAVIGLVLMWIAIALSYYLLALATTGIPVGVAFAFWEGLGLTLVTVSSIFILRENITLSRILGIICVMGGAYLVHLGTDHGSPHRNKPVSP